MTNISKLVWDYIDQRIEIQKTLLEGLINTSSLARKIARELYLEQNLDGIISAIRRYEAQQEKQEQYTQLSLLLRKAKITTKTKLASILVRRNDTTEKKVGSLYATIPLQRESTLRIFEVTNHIKIILDDELFTDVHELFSSEEIEATEKDLGELTITYRDDITKIPGIFGRLANEMAINSISIIDSMICHWEHIIIVREKDLEKTFRVLLNLTTTRPLLSSTEC